MVSLTIELQCDACGWFGPSDVIEAPRSAHKYHSWVAHKRYEGMRSGWLISRTTTLCPMCHKAWGILLQGAA